MTDQFQLRQADEDMDCGHAYAAKWKARAEAVEARLYALLSALAAQEAENARLRQALAVAMKANPRSFWADPVAFMDCEGIRPFADPS